MFLNERNHMHFELRDQGLNRGETDGVERVATRFTLWVFGGPSPHPKLNMNKRRAMERLDEILAFIDMHKTDDRPAIEIASELGLSRLIWDAALGGEATTYA
jgi:hypothetical protein